jgi:glucuronoarabinoxylan endo-1,4-beta-xylanase
MRVALASALAVLVVAAAAVAAHVREAGASPRASAVTVDLRATRQVIQGFGTSERVWADPHLPDDPRVDIPPAVQSRILRTLYGTLGLTRVRNVLDQGVQKQAGGAFEFAGKLADAHVAYVKQARAYGLRVFFPGPVYLEPWMKEDDPDPTVAWAIAMLRRWRALGVEPALYAPLNEPFIAGNFDPAWMRQVVLRLGRRLRAEGFDTKLVIPDDENPTAALRRAEAVLDDPEARGYVGAVAFHIYRWNEADIVRLRELATRYRLPLWMTEYSSSAYTSWDASMDWAEKMHVLLTAGGVNGIDYLWGFFGEKYGTDAMISIDFDGGAYRSHTVTPVGWIMGHYARFVRPGFVRVATSGSTSQALVSAYKGPGRLVVVATNPTGSPVIVSVRVRGGALRGKVAGTRSTAAAQFRPMRPIAQRRGAFTVTLPPKSVTTLVGAR